MDPVGVAHGNKTMYVKHDVKTACMFGYDESTGCQQCLQRYKVTHTVQNFEYEFNLNFDGRLCSVITGMNRT